MIKAGTLPLNIFRTSDYPKDKVSFNLNTFEEQPVTSAMTAVPFMSHEAIEESEAVEETEVEEEEECDIDSDSDQPTANNDEEDTLDSLLIMQNMPYGLFSMQGVLSFQILKLVFCIINKLCSHSSLSN